MTIRPASPYDAPAIWSTIEPVIRAGETYSLDEATSHLSQPDPRNLIRFWIRFWLAKYEAGEFNEEAAMAASLEEYEARIAALERTVDQLTMENDLLKKNPTSPFSSSRLEPRLVVHGRPAAYSPDEEARFPPARRIRE